jgi:DNA-binding response OmpR family regulator
VSSILVLAIDDERPLLNQLARNLVEYEITIVPASRWTDAEKELRENDFDCILLDLNLVESRGLETFYRLRARVRRETPILVFSGHIERHIEVTLTREGVRCLTKPSDPETLAQHIRDTIAEHEQRELLRQRSKSPPGIVAPQIMEFVSSNLDEKLEPVERKVNRLLDWMNAELEAKRIEAEEKSKDEERRRSWFKLSTKQRDKLFTFVLIVVAVKLGFVTPEMVGGFFGVNATRPQQEQHADPQPRWRGRNRGAAEAPAAAPSAASTPPADPTP